MSIARRAAMSRTGAESELELATMAANMNAETVKEQQKHIRKLESENAGLRGLVKPLLRHQKANKR